MWRGSFREALLRDCKQFKFMLRVRSYFPWSIELNECFFLSLPVARPLVINRINWNMNRAQRFKMVTQTDFRRRRLWNSCFPWIKQLSGDWGRRLKSDIVADGEPMWAETWLHLMSLLISLKRAATRIFFPSLTHLFFFFFLCGHIWILANGRIKTSRKITGATEQRRRGALKTLPNSPLKKPVLSGAEWQHEYYSLIHLMRGGFFYFT